MKRNVSEARLWQFLFFSTVAGYCLYYAPYGVNETDGGFLTGLAWQVLSGKTLYADVVYVRPPLPVWLRVLELKLLPETGALLAERWIFYAKVAIYSGLGARVLASGTRQYWPLAVLGFVVSVHCYPAAAWHTVDGILFGVLATWFYLDVRSTPGAVLSGMSLAACLLCKQSFYPLALVWVILLVYSISVDRKQLARCVAAFCGFLFCLGLFLGYLQLNGLSAAFFSMTTGAASGNQALQHGVFDYLRIQPAVALFSAGILLPVGWCWKTRRFRWALVGLMFWLLLLAGAYVLAIYRRQEFTIPFAQTRLLFIAGVVWAIFAGAQKIWPPDRVVRFFGLLGITWCAAISWGYNLPVLFATPWVFAVLEASRFLWTAAFPGRHTSSRITVLALLMLIAMFRYGYAFVYRDGRRENLQEPLGDIFPALSGIYSSPETADLYRELKGLTQRYGPKVKTLPAFPQANYLTATRPPLPLDWVVEREMQTGKPLVERVMDRDKPVLLIEKTYLQTLHADPQLSLTREYFTKGRVVQETSHFWVVVF